MQHVFSLISLYFRRHILFVSTLLVSAAIVALYNRSLFIAPAGDDWLLLHPVSQMVRDRGVGGALTAIFRTPVGDFYRPLALLPMLVAMHALIWIQLAKLGFLVILYFVVASTARRIGLPDLWSVFVGVATVLHQVFTSVATEIDLWGDLISALGFALLIYTCIRYSNRQLQMRSLLGLTVLLTVITLLSKEAGVACFMIPLLFSVLRPFPLESEQHRGLLASAGAMLMIIVVYFMIRQALGLKSSGEEDYYALHFGANVFKNGILALAALFSPMNTVFVARDGGAWKALAMMWTVLGLVVASSGLIVFLRHGKWRLPVVLFAAALIVQGPVLLMPHLTEANFTRSLALGWLAFALTAHAIVIPDSATWIRRLAVVMVSIWLISDLTAVRHKSNDIVTGQQRAARFRQELHVELPVPPARLITLAILDPGYQGYSVYHQPLYVDFRDGEIPFGVRELYQDPRLDIRYVVVKDRDGAKANAADYLVTDAGDVTSLNQ
jgi:hypothetical protein